MPHSKNKSANDALNILFDASNDVIALASDVGIDGRALLGALPADGSILTGRAVPVLHKKYRGTCRVIFHINKTKGGDFWPLLKFHSFKHGGVTSEFNGLIWVNKNQHLIKNNYVQQPIPLKKSTLRTGIVNCQSNEQAKQQQIKDDKVRLDRFNMLCQQFNNGDAIKFDHPWLKQRLSHYATHILAQRLNLRSFGNEMLLPLHNDDLGHIGFQKIIVRKGSDKKLIFIKKQGLLNGSYIKISANSAFPSLPVALCEGVATGLSVALVWPGEIRIALSANNIPKVRSSIKGNVIIFNDEDVWKPGIDNVGLNSAYKAKRINDIICSPVFSCQSYDQKPTDFNDLLMIDGFNSLSKQIGHVLAYCLEHAKAPVITLTP